MKRIALTGGIATGKSYVLAKLRDHGIPTIDADDIVHQSLESGTPTSEAIVRMFGSDVANADGSIDRASLARKVFADPTARLRLEAIVHPGVYETIRQWFERVRAPVAFASIP